MLKIVLAAVLATAVIVPARAEDPDFLAVGAGWFDVVHQDDTAIEARAEYRSGRRFWIFKPLAGVMASTDGSVHAYTGVLSDFYFGRRLVVSPSVAPGYYHEGSGKDLGSAFEIRSQLEVAYRFDDRSRLGMAFSHMSNAGVGDINPGAESVTFYYSIPLR